MYLYTLTELFEAAKQLYSVWKINEIILQSFAEWGRLS